MEATAVPTTLEANYESEVFTYYDGDLTPMHLTVTSATTTKGDNIVSDDYDCTGIMIWPATHQLCQSFLTPRLQELFNGKRVVELGCGIGLSSVAACRFLRGLKRWVATDLDEVALELCRQNMAMNQLEVEEDSVAQVSRLGWGDEQQAASIMGQLNGGDRFDLVVGADIVYPNTCGQILAALFQSVDDLLTTSEEGIFVLAFATRDGPKTPTRLLEAATKAGFALMECLSPLDPVVATKLPPLLDSKILLFKRSPKAENINGSIGGEDCAVFPGLREAMRRYEEAKNETEDWDAPPLPSSDEESLSD